MGRAGRERTLPRYRVERLVDDVDSLYRVLLAEGAAAAGASDRLVPERPDPAPEALVEVDLGLPAEHLPSPS